MPKTLNVSIAEAFWSEERPGHQGPSTALLDVESNLELRLIQPDRGPNDEAGPLVPKHGRGDLAGASIEPLAAVRSPRIAEGPPDDPWRCLSLGASGEFGELVHASRWYGPVEPRRVSLPRGLPQGFGYRPVTPTDALPSTERQRAGQPWRVTSR